MGRRSVELLPINLSPVGSVLDVGCGIRPALFIECDRYVGIDAHKPYLDAIEGTGERRFICSEWQPALARFARGAFDLVLALDFIEHLTRREGRRFVTAAKRVGQRVAIFTPLGKFPQSYADDEPDQWGMDGGRWQTHRSAWTPDDFEGWETFVLRGFHATDAGGHPLPEPIDAFWAVSG
jgi:SAM-dependent methyltransferase